MTKHTESNLPFCPECNEPFNWNDSVLFVEDKDAYYHENCISIYPISYLVMDKHGDVLGTVDTDVDMAISIMNHGEFVDTKKD